MVWLYRSPIPAGRGGVISSFKWFLPAFVMRRGRGGVGTLWGRETPPFSPLPFSPLWVKVWKTPHTSQIPSGTVQIFLLLKFCEIIMLFHPLPLFHLVPFLFFQFSKLYYSIPFNFYLLLASLIYCVSSGRVEPFFFVIPNFRIGIIIIKYLGGGGG